MRFHFKSREDPTNAIEVRRFYHLPAADVAAVRAELPGVKELGEAPGVREGIYQECATGEATHVGWRLFPCLLQRMPQLATFLLPASGFR